MLNIGSSPVLLWISSRFFSYRKCISIHTDYSSALLQDHVIVTTKIYSVARFVNYYCCQNIRKYTPNHTPNDTLKALLPCSPAGYFSSVLHTGCTGSRPVLAWTLPYFPLYRKCTTKAPFYTITVCRLQQPCYRNINSFPLVSAAISIRFAPFCPA